MRVTMIAMAACSLVGLATAPAHAGIPLGGLERDGQPIEVAQASVASPGVGIPAGVTPGVTAPANAPGSTPLGETTPSTSLATPAPTAAGVPMTAGGIDQSNAGRQSLLPLSALPATPPPMPPTTSSIAPPPEQPTNGFAPQSAAPTVGGLVNPFEVNAPSQGNFNVAPVNRPPEVPSTNGGGNPNVPGWDHP
ncbi:MAG TPA: hypothetical protein VIA18_14900 [Polyangia bacterium]|jgi:hypothetical protein|nr:hypothetical protein [Polyangia bacterium]